MRLSIPFCGLRSVPGCRQERNVPKCQVGLKKAEALERVSAFVTRGDVIRELRD